MTTTVGFYSPLPPARTGVADYSAALADHLEQHCAIRFNRDADVNLYHVGNNSLHAGIYRRALEKPGVVVLHDAVLQHFALGSLGREEYLDEFEYNYGPWQRSIGERLWSERAASAAKPEYFRYPMLKRLVERSISVVVHNPAAARLVRDHCPDANVVEIPHLLITTYPTEPAESERCKRSLAPAGLLFGVFGHLRETKRIMPLLRVFARRPEFTLLLAGEIASRDLRRSCEPFLRLPNIRRIDRFLSAREYWIAAHAVEACLNLRFPAAGETSGVGIALMGAGIPMIFTDSPENERYPTGTCIKVPSGVAEEAAVEEVLLWVAENRCALAQIGRNGAAYVRSEHDASKVAAAFARLLANIN